MPLSNTRGTCKQLKLPRKASGLQEIQNSAPSAVWRRQCDIQTAASIRERGLYLSATFVGRQHAVRGNLRHKLEQNKDRTKVKPRLSGLPGSKRSQAAPHKTQASEP